MAKNTPPAHDSSGEHFTPQGTVPPSARAGHEPESTRVKTVFLYAVAVIATMLVALAATALLMYAFGQRESRSDEPVSPWRAERVDPPLPRLQHDEPPDLASLRQREEAVLNGYGWVDRERGVAHIPIDRAAELYLQRAQASRNDEPVEPKP